MSAKTKIVVLHMKEIIYTGIFLVLGIFLVFLLFFMFQSKEVVTTSSDLYQPGVYTSTITLSNAALEVEVTVDEASITSIRFTNLDESITASYPLIEPAMDELTEQIYETQSLENLTYSSDSQYTSQVIIDAIETAVNKSKLDTPTE